MKTNLAFYGKTGTRMKVVSGHLISKANMPNSAKDQYMYIFSTRKEDVFKIIYRESIIVLIPSAKDFEVYSFDNVQSGPFSNYETDDLVGAFIQGDVKKFASRQEFFDSSIVCRLENKCSHPYDCAKIGKLLLDMPLVSDFKEYRY